MQKNKEVLLKEIKKAGFESELVQELFTEFLNSVYPTKKSLVTFLISYSVNADDQIESFTKNLRERSHNHVGISPRYLKIHDDIFYYVPDIIKLCGNLSAGNILYPISFDIPLDLGTDKETAKCVTASTAADALTKYDSKFLYLLTEIWTREYPPDLEKRKTNIMAQFAASALEREQQKKKGD